MLQLVAGLTVVFVGYVLYEVFKTVSSHSSGQPPASKPPPAGATAAAKAQSEEPVKAAGAPKAEPQPAPSEAKKAEPAAPKPAVEAAKVEPAAEQPASVQLKDPATGEICPVPTNYRFSKKWVKEAIVAEGLLEKVYKTSELDEAASRKVKEALDKFKVMKKYHA